MTTDFDAIFDAITEAIKEHLRNGRRQKDLAEGLGISPTMLRFIRDGTRRVGRRTAEAVLKANPLWLAECLWRHGR